MAHTVAVPFRKGSLFLFKLKLLVGLVVNNLDFKMTLCTNFTFSLIKIFKLPKLKTSVHLSLVFVTPLRSYQM